MITTDMVGVMKHVVLDLPDGTTESFDVTWEDDVGRLIHDFYGWELHVNLNRLLEMSSTKIISWS